MKYAPVLAVTALLLTALQEDAHAYIDPGTGSYIFMLVVSGIIGGLYAVKLSWKRLVAFFTGKRADSDKSDGSNDDVEQ